ncbi:hypothetical protein Hanom_Chr14g01274201 [Helianthus anomalus]
MWDSKLRISFTYVEAYLCIYEDTYDSMYICEGVEMYVCMQMCICVCMRVRVIVGMKIETYKCRHIIEDSQGNGYANDMLIVREKAEWKVLYESRVMRIIKG